MSSEPEKEALEEGQPQEVLGSSAGEQASPQGYIERMTDALAREMFGTLLEEWSVEPVKRGRAKKRPGTLEECADLSPDVYDAIMSAARYAYRRWMAPAQPRMDLVRVRRRAGAGTAPSQVGQMQIRQHVRPRRSRSE